MEEFQKRLIAIEQDLKLVKEANLERKERNDEQLESVCHRVLGLEILASEMKQRLIALEVGKNKPRQIDTVERLQVNNDSLPHILRFYLILYLCI